MNKKSINGGNRKFLKINIIILLILMTFVMLFSATYAWYQVQFKAVFVMDVDASGVFYLYLEVPVDNMGENDRYLSPAVAMPYAVSNGMYMDPLVLYDESDPTPSFVEKVASIKEYDGNFNVQQSAGISINLQYKLSMKSGTDENAQTYSRSEFIYSDVSFVYYDTVPDLSTPEDPDDVIIIEVNPLISQTPDCTFGVLNIIGGQKVFFSLKMHFANVDELVDTNIMSKTSIWCELALVLEEIENE